MVVERFDTRDPEALRRGLRHARLALGKKQAVVVPTDTHYALAVDALSAAGLETLSRVKGWEDPPIPQVLLPALSALPAIAGEIPPVVAALTDAFWPGPVTLIVPSSSTLQVNLGKQHQAVAVRMTSDPVTSELLEETGPLAVSAAHPVGQAVASLDQLGELVGELVAVALVDPDRKWEFSSSGSTVLDARGLADDPPTLSVVREGAVSQDQLREVVGDAAVWG